MELPHVNSVCTVYPLDMDFVYCDFFSTILFKKMNITLLLLFALLQLTHQVETRILTNQLSKSREVNDQKRLQAAVRTHRR